MALYALKKIFDFIYIFPWADIFQSSEYYGRKASMHPVGWKAVKFLLAITIEKLLPKL